MSVLENLSSNLLIAGAALLALALALIVLWRRRKKNRTPEAQLQAMVDDVLSHFLIADGEGGEIHVELAALTSEGVLVIDIKRVDGHVFGSDAMQDWTVIDERRRFTFANPQPALYDRIAAVKRLLPEVPVSGYVVFTDGADFSKGLPSRTQRLDSLIEILNTQRREAVSTDNVFRSGWEQLRHEAVAAQFGQLMKDG